MARSRNSYNRRKSGKYSRKLIRGKKRSYMSRLSDKKVNTLVELRMQEVARKEDRRNVYKNFTHIIDSGNWLGDGQLDPNNAGLGLRPTPNVYNIAWSAHDAIPAMATTVTPAPGITVTRLNTIRGQRLTNKIALTSVVLKGVILIPEACTDVRIKMGLYSVKVPLGNRSAGTGWSITGYETNILDSVCSPDNNYFFDEEAVQNFKTQRALKVIVIKTGAKYGVARKLNWSFRYRFKKPYIQEYEPDDPSGTLPINKFLYFAVCTDIDQNSATSRPHLYMNHKVYYHDVI